MATPSFRGGPCPLPFLRDAHGPCPLVGPLRLGFCLSQRVPQSSARRLCLSKAAYLSGDIAYVTDAKKAIIWVDFSAADLLPRVSPEPCLVTAAREGVVASEQSPEGGREVPGETRQRPSSLRD